MSLFPKVGRKQGSVRIAWWTVVALLCLGVFLHLLPFYFMISTSFKTGVETMADPPTLWPQHPTLAAWQLVLQITNITSNNTLAAQLLDEPLYVYFWNSIFMTVTTLLISLPITALAAYANSKLQRGPIARWSFLFFIGTLMVPFAVVLLPTLLLTLNFPFALTEGSIPNFPGTDQPFPTLRIWDTPWAVIIPAAFNAFNFLLFKGFFDTIPNSIIQAARVDGGSEFNIFRRIVFPMSIPVFAVAAWIQFGAVWDNFLWPSLAFRSPDKIPTSVAIYTLMNRFTSAGITDANQAMGQSMAMKQLLEAGLSWNGLMVLGLLQTLPIFVMFIICREYLLRGVRLRGLK
ncbi:MAG TPA: carbohydrate ABC transporter permease [Ktedonobacteraceae bacterium]|nr:carbohydrate ABC transporter permease [Ktedonobacteraceae bacterium]